MTNYSYLKNISNGKEILIDFKKLIEELNSIDCNYLSILTISGEYLGNIYEDIKNFEDYANRLDGDVLCGYLTNGVIKKLCKSGLCMKSKDSKYPIMYLEEEGWDRLHYFKFFPGTEKVEYGSFAFNFYEENYINKYKNLKKIDKIEDNDDLYYEYIREKREDYIFNIINDESTNWNKYFLDYNKKEDNNDFSGLLTLLGIRSEEIINNPEKFKELIKDFKL